METKKRFAGKDYGAFRYSINISFKAEVFQVIKKGGIKNLQTFQVIDIFFIKTEIFYKLLEMLKPRRSWRPLLKRAFAIVNWYKSVIKPFIFIPPFLIYLFSRLIVFHFPHHGNRSFPSVQDNTSPFLVIRHF